MTEYDPYPTPDPAPRVIDLSADISQAQADMMRRINAMEGLQGLMRQLQSVDTATYEHCQRVSRLAIGTLLASGADEYEVLMAGVAGLAHDIGKGAKSVQDVIRSPLTVEEAPHLYDIIKMHPRIGATILHRHGFPATVVRAVGLHHAFQTGSRPAYGIEKTMYAAHNLSAPVAAVVHAVAACDVVDATYFDARREYRSAKVCSAQATIAEIESLRIDDAIKEHALSVAGVVY